MERAQAGDDEPPPPDLGVDLENARGPPREYLAQEPIRRAVAAQFRAFLRDFVDARGERVYRARVRDMCAANRQSLEVSYTHLCVMMPTVAVWVADAPRAVLDVLHGAATDVALAEFPEYGSIHAEVYVRIADLPIQDSIRDLRQARGGRGERGVGGWAVGGGGRVWGRAGRPERRAARRPPTPSNPHAPPPPSPLPPL